LLTASAIDRCRPRARSHAGVGIASTPMPLVRRYVREGRLKWLLVFDE
jgi:hypothetical protein